LGRIQQKFVSLCHHCFSTHLYYSYGKVLNYLKLHTLSVQRHDLDVLSYIFNGSKYFPTLLETMAYASQMKILRDFSLFNVNSQCWHYPSV
jgi:hypothetical protein